MENNNYMDIVSELNGELFDKMGDGMDLVFTYKTTGDAEIIEFGGITLWCSECEEREWSDENNDYEPMEPYIKKKFNELADQLAMLKF